jgi:hypothetical protein
LFPITYISYPCNTCIKGFPLKLLYPTCCNFTCNPYYVQFGRTNVVGKYLGSMYMINNTVAIKIISSVFVIFCMIPFTKYLNVDIIRLMNRVKQDIYPVLQKKINNIYKLNICVLIVSFNAFETGLNSSSNFIKPQL